MERQAWHISQSKINSIAFSSKEENGECSYIILSKIVLYVSYLDYLYAFVIFSVFVNSDKFENYAIL